MFKRILFTISLLTASLVAPALAGDLLPVKTDTGYDARLTGQWLSKGYGYVLDIAPDHLTVYHVAGKLCLKDPRDGEDPDGLFAQWQPHQARRISLTPGADETLYGFERIDGLPKACRSQIAWTSEQRFAFVTATLKAHLPDINHRVDWTSLETQVRRDHAHITNDAELWQALSIIYTALNDAHADLSNDDDTLTGGEAATIKCLPDEKAWLRAWRDGVLNDVLAGKGHHVGNQKIFWGRRGDVGYLAFMTMGGYSADDTVDDRTALDAVMDEALTAFQGARAVIIDVSNNRGGYDSISRAIASRFAAEPHLAYTKVPAATPNAKPQAFHIQPSHRIRYTGPVYVLTSDITVSAGETFVMAMDALPNVTTIGTKTRGALSDQLPKPLDNGWTFTLPAEIYTDSQGRKLEGIGLTPDQPLDINGGADPLKSHSQAVTGLIDGLNP